MRLLYSEYLALVLNEYRLTGQPLCHTAAKITARYYWSHEQVSNYKYKLIAVINRTIYNKPSLIPSALSFLTALAESRKGNSYVHKQLINANPNCYITRGEDRARIMHRFRVKYLEQLIRLAKQTEQGELT